jgi:C-terminal processing protease CtpA/Prc
VTLDKEGPGYGFTLRGGMRVETMRAFPFTVVSIRAGSSADRDEHMRVGDRVTQVNGYKVTHLTLTEIWGLLQQCGHQTTFTVAYDVAVMGM